MPGGTLSRYLKAKYDIEKIEKQKEFKDFRSQLLAEGRITEVMLIDLRCGINKIKKHLGIL